MYQDFSIESEQLALIRGERLLFKQCSFSMKNGQVLQIRGPNGAGKTSLLRVLCGIMEPDQGDVLWCGKSLRKMRESFGANVLYLGHQIGVKRNMTVRENLLFYSNLRQAKPLTTIEEAIQAVGLTGYEDELAAHLSQGQTRRVSLARLLTEPSALWILDEPFVALDVEGQGWLAHLFEQHLAKRGSVIFTSHQSIDLNVKVNTLEVSGGSHA
ncbi:cytochrome c biogenesis heme-transporting ATPase CcmA [Pleionea sediminis]|uniref:cytochrome c biogenesis heme-transporting ATPase CcmA n=1 Tax=Pleionea sediminis TaxID=2569479 RepID=UPI0011847E5C|nr:cytochrome c biogenesis heme-transporting ATPase CcmA [Pleionea sediminis]